MASASRAAAQGPEHALSTAPASPENEYQNAMQDTQDQPTDAFAVHDSYDVPPDGSTVGMLEYEDAVEEVIVKTIKVKRTIFPPLITQPPSNLQDRDPRQYVLAHAETPSYLKRVQVEQDGRTITLQEAENPRSSLQAYHDRQRQLHQHNGHFRRVLKDGKGDVRTEVPLGGVRESNGLKRTATPLSGDAPEFGSTQRRAKKPRSHLHRTELPFEQQSALPRLSSASFVLPNAASPMTPDGEAGGGPILQARSSGHGKKRPSVPVFSTTQEPARLSRVASSKDDDVEMSDVGSPEDDSQLGPPTYGKHKQKQKRREENAIAGASRSLTGATTPPAAEDEVEVTQRSHQPDRQRPQLHNILTSSQNDASLPSPSLSPITAAANAASRTRNRFDESFGQQNAEEDAGGVSGLDLDQDNILVQPRKHRASHTENKDHQPAPVPQAQQTMRRPAKPPLTMQDIPRIIEFVDTLPDQVQKYVLYQLLRRTKKPVLQMIANVVNPALKSDPFNVLPDEIGLNIVRYLDVQSMCRAASVSKRWREVVNSDETAWRDLLRRDDITLPREELKMAVERGWGWQIPGEDGAEQDLKDLLRLQTAREAEVAPGDSDDDDSTSNVFNVINQRLTRKSSLKPSASRKKARRSGHSTSSNTKAIVEPWRRRFKTALGPRDYHEIAIEALPSPEAITAETMQLFGKLKNKLPPAGLPSLKNMHLFKALYQRHYLIRKAWMKEESQPQHLAFRAHHRHVVTCLLFDSDKILTGSDDTKICVYDTKTGALRMRLEGHDGGVWALQYEGDTLVSGSTDRSVRVWDIKTGRCLQVFQGHTSTVRCLVILQPVIIGQDSNGNDIKMPKEPLIITGSRDSTLRVWKLPKPTDRPLHETGAGSTDQDNPYFLRSLSGHHNSVRAIAAYGDTLVSGSYDCTVRVWKISTGDLVHRLQGHTQKVYSVVLDHARNRCISGSMDNLVKVWDLQTGSCLFNLEGHTSLVGLLDLSHDRLVSAAADSTLRIWDPENGACKATLSAHTGAITCFQHDGQKVISGSDRTLKMWNVKTGECVRDLLTDLSGVWQVRFDERRCVAAVQRNNYTYIEVSSERLRM